MKVLIMDDEPEIRAEIAEALSEEGIECLEAVNCEGGLAQIRQDTEIAIVLADIRMPGQSGLDMVGMAKAEWGSERELEFIVITGHGSSPETIDALKLGVLDFLIKPVDIDHLIHVVRRAEELVYLKRARRHYEQGLKADVEAKTLEIKKLYGHLEAAYEEALDSLAVAAEYKDPETGNHIHRIGTYAKFVAGKLGWSEQRQQTLLLAAPLHDVGKIGTPDSVLLKPGKLTRDEVVVMKQHAEIGQRILSRSNHPVMRCAASIAGGHHERWDGGGYPLGLKGTEIPIEARITSLVDVYDALRSERPYKPGFDQQKTLSIMLEGDGRTDPSHFDPEVLAIFRAHSDDFADIFASLGDPSDARTAEA